MNERKVFNWGVSIVIVLLLASCAVSVVPTRATFSGGEYQPIDSNVDLTGARAIAENKMADIKEWEGAQISGYYFWENPMVKGPAYIEYKITKDNKNKGYLFVSLTDLDVPVPQYYTKGKTLYETLEDKTGRDQIRTVRFSAFEFMSETLTARGDKQRVFLGSPEYLYYTSTEEGYDNYYKQYLNSKLVDGAIGGKKEYLDAYYNRLKDIEKKNSSHRSAKPPYPKYIKSEITNRKACLPKYIQYSKPGFFTASGCAPTAAAMIFGYWYLYHGKTEFFNSTPSINWAGVTQNEKDVIEKLHDYMHTSSSGWTGNLTYYLNGLKHFISDFGYDTDAIVLRSDVDRDNGWWGWCVRDINLEQIFYAIKGNRPCILNYASHAAAIYATVTYMDVWNGLKYGADYSVHTGWEDYSATGSVSEMTVSEAGSYLNCVIAIEI